MFTAAAFATVDLLELHALVRALKYNRSFANKYERQIICDILFYIIIINCVTRDAL